MIKLILNCNIFLGFDIKFREIKGNVKHGEIVTFPRHQVTDNQGYHRQISPPGVSGAGVGGE